MAERMKTIVALAHGALLCVALCGPAGAQALDSLTVTVDQAKVVNMPPRAATLILGNPMIADVTMLKGSGVMVVTGKGYGETNLIALDKSGQPIAESMIRVTNPRSVLVVQRGMERESYSCQPQCMPTVQLGDGKLFTDTTQQIINRNSLANPAAPPR